MANIFTPSGKVIPATGNITFNSNASSNAVRQVFGESSSNMLGLVGSNVDTGTRPPPFTALTVPTAASGNLKLSYFTGKSLFLTSPSTYNVGNITSTTLTPTLAGGGGTSYQIAVGTSSGTSNTVGWRAGVNGTQITELTFTIGSNYYISAYSSNATNGTASLAIANASAYGIPNNPTSPTITLTTLSNWSVAWTAPTGIAPTGYTWFISNVTASSVFTGPSNTASTSASGTATLLQDNDYRLYVLAYRPESTSGNANTTSSNLPSPTAPSLVTISSKSMITDRYTPSITGGSGLYVILGTVSGGSAPTTAWSSGYILQPITTGTSYYLSAKSSNTTTGTTSAVVTSSAVGIPNFPASLSITLTSLSNWSVSWAAGSGIAPTGYDWAISNTTTNSLFSNGSTSSTTVSGTSTLLQDNDYQLYVSANRPESYSSTTVSSTSKLPSPAAPSLVTVSSITTSNYTPSITGGSGLYVILGTASGGSTPTTSWSSGVITQTITIGTSYYLSAKSSNTTTGTTSAVVTSSAVGIPNPATGVTLTITSLTNWSFSWTAPASGIAPTGYSWYLNTVNNSIAGAIASGTTTSAVTTGARTTTLTGGSTYYGLVVATRPESSSTLAASAGVQSLSAPTNFQITSMTTTTVSFSWTAGSGATSYTLSYSGTASGSVTGITGTTYTWTHGLGDGGYTCTLASVSGGTGPSSGAAYFGKYATATTSTTYTAPVAKAYTVLISGAAGGGTATSNPLRSPGGTGRYITGTVTLAAVSYTVKVGGVGGLVTGGINGGGAGYNLDNYYTSGGGGGYSQFGTKDNAASIIAGGGGGGGCTPIVGSGYNVQVSVTTAGASGYNSGNINNGSDAAQAYGTNNSYYTCCCESYLMESSGNGGFGGTLTAGGAGGGQGGNQGVAPSTAGSSLLGGTGGACGSQARASGGGGGGGYYGGGGGGAGIFHLNVANGLNITTAAGGGGGSSFVGSSFSSVSSSEGSSGNGYVCIYG